MNTGSATTSRRRRADLSPVESQTQTPSASISYDDVARRAYERFLERGRQDGADVSDWLEAERELLAAKSIDS